MSSEFILRSEIQRSAVLNAISVLNIEKEWSITIKRHVKKRSLSQNALYFSWINLIADATGNSPEDCHEAFKDMFLPRVTIDMGGDLVKVHPSTTKLTTLDFSDYMAKVERYAVSELGLRLPHPEDAHLQAHGRAA